MAYEERDNSGTLFRNDRREKATHPNATGKALIGGVAYYVSAWTKTGKNGDKFQSLAFKPVDESRVGGRAPDRPAPIRRNIFRF